MDINPNEVQVDQPQAEIPADQVQPDQINPDEVQLDSQQPQDASPSYNTPAQQTMAALEGAAQGIAGPIAPLIETKVLGVNPADIAGRAAENPWTHHGAEAAALAGSMLTGTGEAGLIARAIPEFSNMSKIGSLALRSALESAALQGSDELSKTVLNQSDPTDTASNALAHIAGAGILGAATGGIFGLGDITASAGLKAIENQKLVNRAQSWLAGIGAASKGQTIEDLTPFLDSGLETLDKKALQKGMDFHNNFNDHLLERAVTGVGALAGEKILGPAGIAAGAYTAKKFIDPLLEVVLQKPVSALSNKYVLPAVVKTLTSNTAKALPGAIEMALKAAKGSRAIEQGLNSIFKSGGQQALDSYVDQRDKDKLDEAVQDNVVPDQMANPETPQNYSEGGEVKQDGNEFAQAFPAESSLFQSAKGRVFNHLKSLRPQKNITAKAYDNKEPTAEQKRSYDLGLELAANPLSIMKHMKQGSITSKHIAHMNAMWPELSDHLRKRITERITTSQLKDEKPSYKTRQGLSMFLGTPLDSTMTPFSIQAAQSAFQPQTPPQAQQPPKLKKGTAKLGNKTNKMYETASQAAESDTTSRD